MDAQGYKESPTCASVTCLEQNCGFYIDEATHGVCRCAPIWLLMSSVPDKHMLLLID